MTTAKKKRKTSGQWFVTRAELYAFMQAVANDINDIRSKLPQPAADLPPNNTLADPEGD